MAKMNTVSYSRLALFKQLQDQKNSNSYVAQETDKFLMTKAERTKLNGIADNANKYELPKATASVLGGVKIGSNISLSDGTISLASSNVTSALGYTPVKESKLIVGASNGTASAATTNGNTYIRLFDDSNAKATIKISGSDAISVKSDANGNITIDGHNTTYSAATKSTAGLMSADDKTKLDSIASEANKYELPIAKASTLGGVKIGSNITETTDGTISLASTNVTSALGYTPVKETNLVIGASNSTSNAATTNGNTYIRLFDDSNAKASLKIVGSNATTVTSSTDGTITISSTNTTYSAATTSAAGLMSAADKAKLDSIAASATRTTDTHYTAKVFTGASGATANAATTNGNTYITLTDNNAVTSRLKIVGSGATTVTGASDGTITISSTNTTYNAATTSAAGLMSAADKAKLDGIPTDTIVTQSYADANYLGISATAAAASKLAKATTFRVNLASTSTASYDGSANVTPGVTGTLAVANGGTGQSNLSLVNVGTAASDTNGKVIAEHTIEYIVGTQTASTNKFSGTTLDAALYDGKTIAYRLPYAANSTSATLTLKLKGGTSTAAIPVYRYGTTRLTSQYGANYIIIMTYDKTLNRWYVAADYDSNQIDRYKLSNAIAYAEATNTTTRITCATAAGYKMLSAGTSFDINYAVCVETAIKSETQTSTTLYEAIPSVNCRTYFNGIKSDFAGLTANKRVYIKGTLEGNMFTVFSDINEAVTTTIPTEEDGYYYYCIGYAYSTYQINFNTIQRQICAYMNGQFGPINLLDASENFKGLMGARDKKQLNSMFHQTEKSYTVGQVALHEDLPPFFYLECTTAGKTDVAPPELRDKSPNLTPSTYSANIQGETDIATFTWEGTGVLSWEWADDESAQTREYIRTGDEYDFRLSGSTFQVYKSGRAPSSESEFTLRAKFTVSASDGYTEDSCIVEITWSSGGNIVWDVPVD